MNGVQTVRNFVIWPNPRAGKIKRILCSYWQPKPFLFSQDISRWSRKKKCSRFGHDKSVVDKACSVMMSGYWPRPFLRFYRPRLLLGP